MHEAAIDLIKNVRVEMARIHNLEYSFETPLEAGDIHNTRLQKMSDEKEIIQEHARHFLHKVESLISIE